MPLKREKKTNPSQKSSSCGLGLGRQRSVFSPHGQEVGLGVDDVLVQRDQVGLVAEEQEEVLEGLAQEEALHLVAEGGLLRVLDVADGRVAPAGDLGVLLEGLEDVPAPLPVDGVLGDAVQVEEALDGLRPEEVVGISRL